MAAGLSNAVVVRRILADGGSGAAATDAG